MKRLSITTRNRNELVDITHSVESALTGMKDSEGVCTIFVQHTTAGITLNENADPDVATDFLRALDRMVPESAGYLHTEGNSPAHVKSSLMGFSVSIPVSGGKLMLGTWQGIYLCEFDGPRTRQVVITFSEV